MPIWITKYALTGGLIKMSAPQDAGDGYVKDAFKKNDYRVYKLGNDAFSSEAEAKANAEKRRTEKILSLERQIQKLKAMTFI